MITTPNSLDGSFLAHRKHIRDGACSLEFDCKLRMFGRTPDALRNRMSGRVGPRVVFHAFSGGTARPS